MVDGFRSSLGWIRHAETVVGVYCEVREIIGALPHRCHALSAQRDLSRTLLR